ncbi:MAG: NAD(P)-dependent oxidoreductase [Pseudomonadota bacterium]
MRILVTGSTGHLGEALMRLLPLHGHTGIGLDIAPGRFTDIVGSVTDSPLVHDLAKGCDAVLHTATLHKPHVATHARQAFVDTNVSGTLTLLEAAIAAGVARFVFTSTTSAFGAALTPGPGEPAAWIDERVGSIPKNIYGVTKTAAEDLCALFAQRHGLTCTVLRTSRFFPEEDDNRAIRESFGDTNAKANEFLYRRADIEDIALAHLAALDRSAPSGFARYVISATTPFRPSDLAARRREPAAVVAAYYPSFAAVYEARGFSMFPDIGRVYVNEKARRELGWQPHYDFARILEQLAADQPIGSALARAVGSKGYHSEIFADGPYPVDTAS